MAKKTLNPQQQQAVKQVSGPVLVLAGAGSGKTSVIVQKIAYLLKECQLPAKKIVSVTFTNKAAREMQQRVKQEISGDIAKGLKICTFHSLGLDILRREAKTLGLKSGFTLLDASDSRGIIADLIAEERLDASETVDLATATISRWKSELRLPVECLQNAKDDEEHWMARVFEGYERRIKAFNAVDFEDLIRKPTLLLSEDVAVREKWQGRVGYMLVDEYQDTNLAQYQLMKNLVAPMNHFTVVGDDDQSIYAWRGARPENLTILEQEFPTLNVIKLEQNYRSTNTILNAANAVIANNPHVFEKKLWSQFGEGDPIRVVSCEDEKQEVEWVGNHVLSHKLRSGWAYSDYAVLYRGNHQARTLEMVLQGLQIPYRISGGTAFFGRTEIKDVMAYLRLLINESDDNAFLRIVNVPKREIGAATIEKLAEYATHRQCSMLTAIDELGLEQVVQGKSLQRLRQFRQWLLKMGEATRAESPEKAVHQLLSDIEYRDWLDAQCSTPKAAQRRWENIEFLIQSLQKSCEQIRENTPSHESIMEAAIRKLLLRDMLEQKNEDEELDAVNLMTLHASKGLEFAYVVLMGLEEGLLPHQNSLDEGFIEEERRLFYVGITRAKRKLVLTYADQRQAYGEKMNAEPSRFLHELPADAVVWKSKNEPASEQEQQAVAKSHLANIRGLLEA